MSYAVFDLALMLGKLPIVDGSPRVIEGSLIISSTTNIHPFCACLLLEYHIAIPPFRPRLPPSRPTVITLVYLEISISNIAVSRNF